MKTLSIKQPWASLIAHGVKNIENRTWKTNFRGRIYIHASAKTVDFKDLIDNDMHAKEQLFIHSSSLRANYEVFKTYPHGAIIGEVEIVDCVINHENIWAEKTEILSHDEEFGYPNYGKPIYNWVLANAVLYDEPILNVKGKLSLWEFEKLNP